MTSKTSITYGGALYDRAKDEGLMRADPRGSRRVRRRVPGNPDYRRLLTEPSIPRRRSAGAARRGVRDALHPYTLNFVKLLCANGTVCAASGL